MQHENFDIQPEDYEGKSSYNVETAYYEGVNLTLEQISGTKMKK